jgi:hypothetical protein
MPIPFELGDLGIVKLLFADVASGADAAALLSEVRAPSEDRVRALEALEPIAAAADAEGADSRA